MSGTYTFDIKQSATNTRYYNVSIKHDGSYFLNCPRKFSSVRKAEYWISGWKKGMEFAQCKIVSVKNHDYPATKYSPNWKAFLTSQTREFKDYGLKFRVSLIDNALFVNGHRITSDTQFKTAYTDGFVNGCITYCKRGK